MKTKLEKENFLFEVTELPYDSKKLASYFEQIKNHGRCKGLAWRPNQKIPTFENARALVYQHSDYLMLDLNQHGKGINLLDNPYIKELVSVFNFDHEIISQHVDIVWNRPGYDFKPHVDGYAATTVFWSFIPEVCETPINFYYRDDVVLKQNQEYLQMTDDDIVFSHYYSAKYPAIFNSHQVHGVKPVTNHRVQLRLRINESYDSVRKKYQSGTLIKKDIR